MIFQQRIVRAKSLLRNVALVCLPAILFTGCANYEYHETENVALIRYDESARETITEQELLDVGIVLFELGLELIDEDTASYSSVRQSEAVWFASQLKSALDYSNLWGSVRTMPSANSVADMQISGKILESSGEQVKITITATDATGNIWFTKEYFQRASAYAYNPEVNSNRDPFQSMFAEMANDLFDYHSRLTTPELILIRNVSKVRFAQDFLPKAYASFIVEQGDGYDLTRIPASNDPMIQRIDQIRARNDLFLDVVQDYYRVFNGKMAYPYQEWRKASYKEVIYERQLKDQARKQKIAGVASILMGIYAQTSGNRYTRGAGHIGIFAGADLIRRGYNKQGEALLHTAALRELGASLESELEPSIIDLQDRSITLSGTVDEQFQEWKRILLNIYNAENGLEDSLDETSQRVENQSSTDQLENPEHSSE